MKLLTFTHYQIQMMQWRFEGRGFKGLAYVQLFWQSHTDGRFVVEDHLVGLGICFVDGN